MKYVIDFHGFHDEDTDEYLIKEYCIVPIESKIGQYSDNIYDTISYSSREASDRTNYEKSGIHWSVGYISEEQARALLQNILKSAEKIYLTHPRKLDLIKNFIKQPIDPKKFVILQDFDIKLNQQDICKFHDHFEENICIANSTLMYKNWVRSNLIYKFNENYLSLVRSLEAETSSNSRKENDLMIQSQNCKPKEFVFDFTGYHYAKGKFAFKEFCIAPVPFNILEMPYSRVVQSPCKLSELSKLYRDAYDEFYEKYGIKWEVGDISGEKAHALIQEKLKSAAVIYLKNSANRRQFLKLMGGKFDNIVVLSEYNYNPIVKSNIMQCGYHNNPLNVCCLSNALACSKWLSNILWPNIQKFISETDDNLKQLVDNIRNLRGESSELEDDRNNYSFDNLKEVGDFDSSSDNSDSTSLANIQKFVESYNRNQHNFGSDKKLIRKRKRLDDE